MSAAWRRVLAIVAIFLGVFLLARGLLLTLYPDHFNELAALEIFRAFARGVVFDLSIILVFIGVPLLLMLLPWRWAGKRWWQGVWGWYCYAVLCLFLLVIGAI